jgi:hypothetical protein
VPLWSSALFSFDEALPFFFAFNNFLASSLVSSAPFSVALRRRSASALALASRSALAS